jgi:hypothetical protein
LKLEAIKYEIKSKIIKMAAANPFEGMVTENPYRHIRHFTTLLRTMCGSRTGGWSLPCVMSD